LRAALFGSKRITDFAKLARRTEKKKSALIVR
jgi:hypothetical protein